MTVKEAQRASFDAFAARARAFYDWHAEPSDEAAATYYAADDTYRKADHDYTAAIRDRFNKQQEKRQARQEAARAA